MPIPDYATTGLPHDPMVDTWKQQDMYIDPDQTEMEGGNIVARAAPGDDVERIQFTIKYTKAQYATFKTFVKTTLNKGSSRFTMQVWLTDGFENRTVMMAAKPQPEYKFPNYYVAFDLRVFP